MRTYPNRILRAYEAVFCHGAYWLSRTPIVVMSRKQLEAKQEDAFQLGTWASSGHVTEGPKPPRHLHAV